MSLLLMDGFDHGNLFGKYLGSTGCAIGSASPIHGSWASAPQNNGWFSFAIPAAQQDDAITVAAYILRGSGVATDDSHANGGFFRFMGDAGATNHITVAEYIPDGSIRVRRGSASGTILGQTPPGTLMVSTWFHVACRVVLHDTTGTVELWVNGVKVLDLSGLDTKNAGTAAVFDQIQFHGSADGGNSRQFDDCYITNDLGGVNTGYLGVCKVNTLLPTADGTTEDWARSAGSDSWALVDENPHNSDTDYIQSDVPAAITQLGMADLTDLGHIVKGVAVLTNAKKDDAGVAAFRNGIRSGGVNGNGADKNLTEAYLQYWDMFELDPNGDIPWTAAAVNAAEAFVEVR